MWEADEFWFEFGSFFDDGVAGGWAGVFGVEGAEDDVVFDLEFLAIVECDEFVGCFLSFECLEAVHHAFDIVFDSFIADDGAWAHALEVSL